MKKSLVLAMTIAMGITANAHAANPFSDVPAGHWAYDAISRLANAGVIDGYGSTFGGEKLITRYEMAQIVAKAMSKGANCDKLSAEFADELQALGVKVAKLENKMDNVKITGNIRYSYRDTRGNYTNPTRSDRKTTSRQTEHGKGYNRLRSRFWINGRINDNWSYTGMFEQNRYLDSANSSDSIYFPRAWLTGRIGGLKVEMGRCYFLQMSMIDGEGDGIKADYSVGKTKFTAWAMKNQAVLHHGTTFDGTDPIRDEDRLYMFRVAHQFGKLNTYVGYWDVDCPLGTDIIDVCLSYPIAKDLTLTGEYFHGNGQTGDNLRKSDHDGYEVKLAYRGAKAAVPGSWGIHAVYSDRPFSTLMSQSTFAGYAAEPVGLADDGDGFKGWEFGANYVFAKNITGGIKYFDYETRKHADGHARTIWSEVVFIF